jgi:predicted nucleotidyltransferase
MISSKSIIWDSSTTLKLLTYFMENPTQEFYAKEVSDKTGISTGATHDNLKKLSREGFLRARKKGRMTLYQLEKESEVVKHLKIAYTLSKNVVDKLKEIGKKLDVEIYLYGSAARGENKEESDWDLLIIGNVDSSKLEKNLDSIKTDENLKPSLYTQNEWNQTEEKDPAFFERVEKDRIRLI